MVQLQQPPWVYMNGKLRKWDEAVLHISTEAVTRGLNVYEGLKGYWRHDGSAFGIVAMRRHFARLQRSAKLLYIPCALSFEDFRSGLPRVSQGAVPDGQGHVASGDPLRCGRALG